MIVCVCVCVCVSGVGGGGWWKWLIMDYSSVSLESRGPRGDGTKHRREEGFCKI